MRHATLALVLAAGCSAPPSTTTTAPPLPPPASPVVALPPTKPVPPPPSTVPARKQTMSRWDFEKKVRGLTFDKVIQNVGKPDHTESYNRNQSSYDATWTYLAVTFDPMSGKPDVSAEVYFRNNIVDNVAFR